MARQLSVQASESRAATRGSGKTGGGGLPLFVSAVLTIAAKDLRSEMRTKEALNASVAFSIVILVLFSFAFDPTSDELQRFFGRVVVAGVLLRGRAGAEPELRAGNAERLPGRLAGRADSASALFLGKALANFALLMAVELVSLPVFGLVLQRALDAVSSGRWCW